MNARQKGYSEDMLARLQSFPDNTSLSYASVNVDTAALQIESGICPQFRGYKTTSEYMRRRLTNPRGALLLSVKHSKRSAKHGRGVSDTRKRSGTSRVGRLFKCT